MDMGISRYGLRGTSNSVATNETSRVTVPGPLATHDDQIKFIKAIPLSNRQRDMLASLDSNQLDLFVKYFRVKGVEPNDADAVARFINQYEQYCVNKKPDRDSAIAS